MTVYDVVQIVTPGCRGSIPPGRWLVDHHDIEHAARQRADLYNACNSNGGLRYEVESHDEESPERANYVKDWRRNVTQFDATGDHKIKESPRLDLPTAQQTK